MSERMRAVVQQQYGSADTWSIGEVPMLHQVTFSIWPDAASMANFARGDGPHGRAIRAVREGGWFNEELYARFRLIGTAGTWGGRDPVAHLLAPQAEAA